MASGLVVAWNRRRGFIAVACDDDALGFSVIEVLDSWEPDLGDSRLSGALDDLGAQTLQVEGTQRRISVFVQDCRCSLKRMGKLME